MFLKVNISYILQVRFLHEREVPFHKSIVRFELVKNINVAEQSTLELGLAWFVVHDMATWKPFLITRKSLNP